MDKVIFDSRWFGQHGIGRFAHEIFKANENFKKIKLTGNPAGKFDCLKLTLYLLFNKEVYFSPGYNSPLFFLSRTYITVHDLNHIDILGNSSHLKRLYYNWVLKRTCRKAKSIITVSEFTKRRIVEWSGRDADDIIVVNNGVSEAFNVNAIPYNNEKPYILMVGNRKPHKNEINGVKAFLHADIDKSIQLLLTGESTEALSEIIIKNNASERIKFVGKVSEETLASLYKGATFLFFPSLYEGFGLPIIESMACGTPVLTSNVTSLPEVAGDAAFYIDPNSLDSMKSGIEVLLHNKKLQNDLTEKGFLRVKNYSWDVAINKINEIFR